jgi:hypothetical protein
MLVPSLAAAAGRSVESARPTRGATYRLPDGAIRLTAVYSEPAEDASGSELIVRLGDRQALDQRRRPGGRGHDGRGEPGGSGLSYLAAVTGSDGALRRGGRAPRRSCSGRDPSDQNGMILVGCAAMRLRSAVLSDSRARMSYVLRGGRSCLRWKRRRPRGCLPGGGGSPQRPWRRRATACIVLEPGDTLIPMASIESTWQLRERNSGPDDGRLCMSGRGIRLQERRITQRDPHAGGGILVGLSGLRARRAGRDRRRTRLERPRHRRRRGRAASSVRIENCRIREHRDSSAGRDGRRHHRDRRPRGAG